MQVILLNDVAKVGKKYEVKQVSDGYAANFLFPRKLAERATVERIKELEKKRDAIVAAQTAHEAMAKEKLASMKEIPVVLERKANEQGHLYDGVKKEEIFAMLKNEHHLDLGTVDALVLDRPIKEVGEHTITVRIGEMESKFTLSVKPQG